MAKADNAGSNSFGASRYYCNLIFEPHRLKALIEEDLKKYANSSIREIVSRLRDVEHRDVQKQIYSMARHGELIMSGVKSNRRYSLKP